MKNEKRNAIIIAVIALATLVFLGALGVLMPKQGMNTETTQVNLQAKEDHLKMASSDTESVRVEKFYGNVLVFIDGQQWSINDPELFKSISVTETMVTVTVAYGEATDKVSFTYEVLDTTPGTGVGTIGSELPASAGISGNIDNSMYIVNADGSIGGKVNWEDIDSVGSEAVYPEGEDRGNSDLSQDQIDDLKDQAIAKPTPEPTPVTPVTPETPEVAPELPKAEVMYGSISIMIESTGEVINFSTSLSFEVSDIMVIGTYENGVIKGIDINTDSYVEFSINESQYSRF